MKNVLIQILLLLIILTSCEKKNRILTKSDLILRDSLLLEYLLKEFDYTNPRKSTLKPQLESMRTTGKVYIGPYTVKNDTVIDKFNLRVFQFDTQKYNPFAIEITNMDNEFISFFTFTDELYYLRNKASLEYDHDNSDNLVFSRSKNYDSLIVRKLNLERNLNELIHKLGYQNNEKAITNIIEVIFYKLLKMQKFNNEDLSEGTELIVTSDSIKALINNEMRSFANYNKGKVFMFRSKEGYFGYWKLGLYRDNDSFKVEAQFFSDIAYNAIFM